MDELAGSWGCCDDDEDAESGAEIWRTVAAGAEAAAMMKMKNKVRRTCEADVLTKRKAAGPAVPLYKGETRPA